MTDPGWTMDPLAAEVRQSQYGNKIRLKITYNFTFRLFRIFASGVAHLVLTDAPRLTRAVTFRMIQSKTNFEHVRNGYTYGQL